MFRKGLTKMLADREEDAIFLEYSLTGNKQRHLCIECIPLPKEEGDMAPMYFKVLLVYNLSLRWFKF